MIWLSLLVAVDAFAGVSQDWAFYRVGARDCRMRHVDAVSRVVTYGAGDCSPIVRARKVVRPKLVTQLAGYRVRIDSESAAPASSPTAGLTNLFPGPSTLRIYRGEELVAETMGTPRKILGVASHGDALVVVFTYERDKGELAIDALGVRLPATEAP